MYFCEMMIKYYRFKYPGGRKEPLTDFDPSFTGNLPVKEQAAEELEILKKRLYVLQDMFFSNGKHSLLVILQGMDASGKDGVVKHVLSGMNPQGLKIKSFGTPSSEEFRHDFMWRCMKEMPEKGQIGVFNRSYYEEVLITKIHPEYLEKQNLHNIPKTIDEQREFWSNRYTDINNYEKYLSNNGVIILKFLLHISYEEQRLRFLNRINNPAKNWKFKEEDIKERTYWEQYMKVNTEMLNQTSTYYAPWYVIPADKKRTSRLIIGQIIVDVMEQLGLEYPKVTQKQKDALIIAKKNFEMEA